MRFIGRMLFLVACALLAAMFARGNTVCVGDVCREVVTGPVARDFHQDAAAAAVAAARKNLLVRFGSNVKRTFYDDCRKRPLTWCLPMALQWAVAFSDDGSSCSAMRPGRGETGPPHFFIGRHPGCPALTAFTGVAMFVNSNSVNWLANAFQESCDRDAADPNSPWWKVDSRTKSTAACFGAVSWGVAGAQAAYEVPAIRENVSGR